MPTIQLTDEEVAAALKYFSNVSVRDYMTETSDSKRKVPLDLADSIKLKLEAAKPDVKPAPTNARIAAIWKAVEGYR